MRSLRFIAFLMSLILILVLSCQAETSSTPTGIESGVYVDLKEKDLFQYGRTRIAYVPDVHHYAPGLYDPESPGFKEFSLNNEGRTVLYTTRMMEILKEDLLEKGIQTLLISGDLSILGTRETHVDMAKILKGFEATGIDVFVTPGNHDINNPRAFRINGAGTEEVETVDAEQFKSIYNDFGFGEALMQDPESLSYLARLNDELYLLALDSSYYQDNYHWGYSPAIGGFNPEQYDFAEKALIQAEADGKKVIVISHHNFLAHYEGDHDLSTFLINDEQKMLNLLMDYDVKAAFSGHIHKSDIKEHKRGDQKFYGVATGSLQIYPHSYHLIGWDQKGLFISTADLKNPMIQMGKEAILEYNRNLGFDRSYKRHYEKYLKTQGPEIAAQMAEYFYLVNLYAQQGLETYLPEEILRSEGLDALLSSGGPIGAFARSLPLDSYPEDRNFRISW